MEARRAVAIRLIPALRRYARSLTADHDHADDLVQQCLEQADQRLDQLEPDQDLRAWLFAILRNLPVDDRSRAGGARLAGLAEDAGAPLRYPTLRREHGNEGLRRAFEALPAAEREALTLIVIEGFSYEAAGKITAVGVETMRERVSRARRALSGMVPQVVPSPVSVAPRVRQSA